MKVLLVIGIIVLVVFLLYVLLAAKYRNPYKLIMVFGKKGCGKSTTLCKLALKYGKKGWKVFSTEHTPGTFYINPKQIGFVQLPPKSLLLIDEVSLLYGNRSFKTFPHEVESFFRLQRHFKVRCYLFSQTFDIDKKLRDLTDEMYLLRNVFHVFSYGKRILKKIVLTKAESDRPSMIAENLSFDSLLFFWAGSRFFTFIPRYSKYFNSFEVASLPEVNFKYEELPKYLRKHKFKLFTRRRKPVPVPVESSESEG